MYACQPCIRLPPRLPHGRQLLLPFWPPTQSNVFSCSAYSTRYSLHLFDSILRLIGALLYVSVMFAVDSKDTLANDGLLDNDSDEVGTIS